MTTYLWDACRNFFIYRYFLPFLLCCVVPLIGICLCTHSTMYGGVEEDPDSPPVLPTFLLYVNLIAFAVGTGMIIYEEILEIVTIRSLKNYATDFHNYFQWLIIFCNVSLIYLMI